LRSTLAGPPWPGLLLPFSFLVGRGFTGDINALKKHQFLSADITPSLRDIPFSL
jgi:hypothetical protein